MVSKELIFKIFSSASMLRWNDKMRPIELIELDKQAHKMIVAYTLGKLEKVDDLTEIIEGGIFELLQRVVIKDLKPQIFYKIKEDKPQYDKLNEWVYTKLENELLSVGDDFAARFKEYFKSDDSKAHRILGAANLFATRWEFGFIEHANPDGYEIQEISKDLKNQHEEYYDLSSVKDLMLSSKLKDFIGMCVELRFQIRWSHVPRVPRTSVLGHSLFVAILTYLFSLEIDACGNRKVNNFYNGLFHDLPEVLTKDIISPVKGKAPGLADVVKKYERQEMEKLYGLLAKDLLKEIERYTSAEFESDIYLKSKRVKVSSEEINKKYNDNKYNPRDGELVFACDKLAAFVEAYMSIYYGIKNDDLTSAKISTLETWKNKSVAGIDFGRVYSDLTNEEIV